MIFLYSTLVTAAALAALPFALILSRRDPGFRLGLRERLGWIPETPDGSASPLWVQAVSVGEVQVARRLLPDLKFRFPGRPLLLTSTTPAGFRLAREALSDGISACYFPLDLPWVVRRAVARVRPGALILVETEIWPNLLLSCSTTRVPVALVNGRISDRSYPRYRLLRPLIRRALSGVGLFGMQSERDAERIRALGAPPDRVQVTGNVKWDLEEITETQEAIRESLGLPGESPILVAGSTSEGEEEVVLSAWDSLRSGTPGLRLILAPRQPDRFPRVAELLAGRRIPFARQSRRGSVPPAPILLLDTIGELRRVYAAGTVCFVGGSLVPRGGQNLMEPAACGRPVLFGPRTENFADAARSLLEVGAGFRVGDALSMAEAVRGLLADPLRREEAGRRGQELVDRNRGAARRTVEALASLLGDGR